MNTKTIHITKIVNGGYGVARLSTGQVTLVRYALPDEDVIITTEDVKKNYLFGKVQQIFQEHPGRIKPPCQYYGQCGGCNLQHCDYPTQLTIKKDILEDLLSRQSQDAVRNSIQFLADPIPSPSAFGYRQRVRLQVGKRGVIGFHRYHSHDIIPIDICLLAGESINKTIAALQHNNEGRRLCELSAEIELQLNPQTGKTVTIFHFPRKIRPADIKSAEIFCRDMAEVERVFFVGLDFPITGPYCDEGEGNTFGVHYPNILQLSRHLNLSWEVGGFCQVNLAQNKALIETVLEFCQVDETETVLDLYCGMGNFSIPLAMAAKEVLGIEGQGSAIRSAKENAFHAALVNTLFFKKSVDNACQELAEKGEHFDCVVIDPPRLGALGLAGYLAKITSKRLIYISCDPATLCRDLADLTNAGFAIKRIQPVDMFPQTHHIETVVLLDK